jgi:hypothetical protein
MMRGKLTAPTYQLSRMAGRLWNDAHCVIMNAGGVWKKKEKGRSGDRPLLLKN